MVYTRLSPLIWRDATERRTQLTHNINNATVIMMKCRNSIQGKTLIVDDEGYVCARKRLTKTGCCALNHGVDGGADAAALSQYDCQSCNLDTGCCAIYEYCVSCCLNPERVIYFVICDTLMY